MQIPNLNNLGENTSLRLAYPVTEDSVNAIIQLIRDSRNNTRVRQTVENILETEVAEKKWVEEIRAVYNFVKRKMHYMRDPDGYEYIKTPDKMIREIQQKGVTSGDCDDHTTLLGSLLINAGYAIRIVIIVSKYNPSNNYNHIYLYANKPFTDEWLSLDATAKDQNFGYEAEYRLIKVYDV